MTGKKNLAIVIPAYKSTFLAAALDSIAAQTCKDFTLYVGDDCSPNDIAEIVDRYRDRIDLVYRRFESNLGGKDLVAQWERCIDMTQGEPWLWLFSDDDVMEEKCVEEFYETVLQNPHAGLLHFNIARLEDATGEIVPLPKFPKACSAKKYLDEKTKGHFVSFVVEFVVRRDIFYTCDRFQNFDLAWGSDMISWIKFADAADGIITCHSARVLWRKSEENISPNMSSPILYRKIVSLIANAKWLADFTSGKGCKFVFRYTKFALGEIHRQRKLLSDEQRQKLLDMYVHQLQPPFYVRLIVSILRKID